MRVLIREYNISGLQRGSCNWSAHSSSRSSKPSLLSVKCERPSSDRVRTSTLFFFGSHLALIGPVTSLLANVYVNYFYFHTWRSTVQYAHGDVYRSCSTVQSCPVYIFFQCCPSFPSPLPSPLSLSISPLLFLILHYFLFFLFEYILLFYCEHVVSMYYDMVWQTMPCWSDSGLLALPDLLQTCWLQGLQRRSTKSQSSQREWCQSLCKKFLAQATST